MASRQFVDSFGFSWQAVEIRREWGSPEGSSRSDNWLYFLSRGTTRRLQAYPADWNAMSWSDLEDLCSRAEVIGADAGFRPVRALSEKLAVAVG